MDFKLSSIYMEDRCNSEGSQKRGSLREFSLIPSAEEIGRALQDPSFLDSFCTREKKSDSKEKQQKDT
jgi:hypothetical protein